MPGEDDLVSRLHELDQVEEENADDIETEENVFEHDEEGKENMVEDEVY